MISSSVLPTDINIDGARLQRQIDELAEISESPAPIVTRVLFSEADLRAREFVKGLCSEVGLTLRQDAVGNIFARWPGTNPTLAPVATGSHIDAIPNAGRYDGVVGVLGALEAIRALREAGVKPTCSIELIIFTSEEPTRFGIGCLGSRLLAGSLSLEKTATLRDSEGKSLDEWRAESGFGGQGLETIRLVANAYSAFVELHIEQGALLEREKIALGVVEKIAAPSSLKMQLTGVGGHAGAMLMPERHDALLAGAEIALAVEQAALTSGSPDTVGTTGVFRIEPGAVNSVPCRAWLGIDFRDTQLTTRDAALKKIESDAAGICAKRGVALEIERVNADAPALCDAHLVQTVFQVAKDMGVPIKKMISRAYHDSLFMAQICPTTMIFIPSRDGISHRPDEYSSPEQIRQGVQALALTLVRLAEIS